MYHMMSETCSSSLLAPVCHMRRRIHVCHMMSETCNSILLAPPRYTRTTPRSSDTHGSASLAEEEEEEEEEEEKEEASCNRRRIQPSHDCPALSCTAVLSMARARGGARASTAWS